MQDGVSTLSSDSGNVHDYAEGSEHKHTHHYLPKSKSMPDYADAQKQDPYAIQGNFLALCKTTLYEIVASNRYRDVDMSTLPP